MGHEAIATRVDELLSCGAGLAAVIPSGTLSPTVTERTRRIRKSAIEESTNPRYQLEVFDAGLHPLASCLNNTKQLRWAHVRVTISQRLKHPGRNADARHQAKAAASALCLRVTRALTFPGNAAATEDGVSTGLVSGLLETFRTGEPRIDAEEKLTTTELVFRGALLSTL